MNTFTNGQAVQYSHSEAGVRCDARYVGALANGYHVIEDGDDVLTARFVYPRPVTMAEWLEGGEFDIALDEHISAGSESTRSALKSAILKACNE